MKNESINLLLTLTYCGTNYSGWQVQPEKKTIQGELELVFFKVFQQKIEVVGSGRTDAGVHALKAKANVILPKDFTKKHFFNKNYNKLKEVLNNFLPNDIKILSIKNVNLNFNARKNAKQKTYLYKILNAEFASPFEADKVFVFNKKIDILKMQNAASYLIGEHNFKAFCSSNTSIKSFIRTIYNISIQKRNNNILVEITGNGFLYNMVRIIVGTLLEIASNQKLSSNYMQKILISQNRTLAGKTAPACGLYLKNVKY